MNRVYLMVLLLAGASVQVFGQGAGRTPARATTPAPRQQQVAPPVQPNAQATAPANTAPSGNPSIRPIPEGDVMYRRTVWRVVDLREKQNRPMFSINKEITKVIMDAVKRGELTVYENDSLNKPLALADYKKRLVMPGEQAEETEEDRQMRLEAERQAAAVEAARRRQQGRNYVAPPAAESAAVGPIEYNPKDIKKLEIKEDVIFDKKRSRMYYDIHAITLKVSNPVTGVDDEVGSFAYKDLVKVFRDHPKEAIWYNMQNDAQHKNLADAFDLRLFSSYIKKVSNPMDDNLQTIHGGSQQAILAAQRAMEEMIEFEYSLWSY